VLNGEDSRQNKSLKVRQKIKNLLKKS